ncbi:MAG: PDZ domain-containing protein, partial [Onishia taeanensis]|uniref:S1C family serine protease n=2 Tax=Halomonadaceae TaxID=28256 RepID=UPI003C7B4AE5
QEMTRELAASFGLDSVAGVVISGIVPDGPADAAGLQPGDVLIKVDGRTIRDARAVMTDIAAISPGTQLPLSLVRNGERMDVTLEVGERPTAEVSQPQSQPQPQP